MTEAESIDRFDSISREIDFFGMTCPVRDIIHCHEKLSLSIFTKEISR